MTLFKLKSLLSLVLVLLLGSCGEESFKVNSIEQTQKIRPRTTSQTTNCSSSTLIKPQVDYLFLWDNSSSTIFLDSSTRAALDNLIIGNNFAERFDYNILHAPLIGTGNSQAQLMTSTPISGSLGGVSLIGNTSQLSILQDSSSGARETGLSRVNEIISLNKANGIFRDDAYTIIVVISNGDDNEWDEEWCSPCAGSRKNIHIQNKLHDLMCLRGNYTVPSGRTCSGVQPLDSRMMRFFSIVAHSDRCQSGYKVGDSYRQMSSSVYRTPYTSGTNTNLTTNSNSYPDSFDICTNSFSNIFDSIKDSIQQQVINHRYNFWPVASSSAAPFDPASIEVRKNTGQEFSATLNPSQDGFNYIGVSTQNTRFSPSLGEPFSGHMIQLFGNAQVTYPECLIVTTKSPVEYFGYVQLNTKPKEETISLKINGANVPRSSTSGWTLVKEGNNPKFINGQNMRITSPTNFSPVSPGLNKTGYFLRLSSNYVYSNGAVIELLYDPSGD
ncbi:MAG: hypothetical protein ACPGJV_08850 [Bacteriovoracaceae bacterium]